MALIKPPVLPVWADSGDKVQPSDVEIDEGWPLTNVPPSRQRFNWLQNFFSNGIRYFSRRGLPDWDAAETYLIGDCIIGDDNKTYRSLVNANISFTPSTSPSQWQLWALDAVDLAETLVTQQYTAFTTAGTAPAFTLSPTPALTSYVAGQRFRVLFHANGTGADTLNVNGLGAKNLSVQEATGGFTNATIKSGMRADVEYDGVAFKVIDALALRSASSAEVIAGLLANVAVTPASLFQDVTSAQTGHVVLNNNVVINWGFAVINDDGFSFVTFDKVNTGGTWAGWATPIYNGAITGGNTLSAHVGAPLSNNGMSIGVSMVSGFAIVGVYYLAIGRL